MSTPDPNRPLEIAVAVHDQRLDDHEEELRRHRERLHLLEADRAALKLIAQRQDDMAETAKANARTLETIGASVQQLLLAQAGSTAVNMWKRFWIGTVGVGVLGAVATLVWLAHG